jgi:hypothetical protein
VERQSDDDVPHEERDRQKGIDIVVAKFLLEEVQCRQDRIPPQERVDPIYGKNCYRFTRLFLHLYNLPSVACN